MMPPASGAPLLCVLNLCGDENRNRDGADADAGGGRFGPVVAAGSTGAIAAARLPDVADPIQGGHGGIYGGIGHAFLSFTFCFEHIVVQLFGSILKHEVGMRKLVQARQ